MIVPNDVKFNNGPLEEEKRKVKKRRIPNKAALIKKRLEEEKYNKEAHEQRYKRLIHLLNKSQFFSSYLINKIEDKEETKNIKRRNVFNDENVPPKKQKVNRIDIEKYNIQEYISTEVSSKIWILE